MDFLNIGFLLSCLDFNLGWELGYITRIAGALFTAVGIRYMRLVGKDCSKSLPALYVTILLGAAGLAQALLLRGGIISPGTGNILSAAAGLTGGAAVIVHQWIILKELLPDRGLVNDPSLLQRLGKAWKRWAVFSGISLTADVAGRLAPNESAPQIYAGVLLAASRIIMYICVISLAAAFIKAARDFSAAHPIDNTDT